jgi:hypothetical protein
MRLACRRARLAPPAYALLALMVAACGEREQPQQPATTPAATTQASAPGASAPVAPDLVLRDTDGQVIPPPRVPPGITAQAAVTAPGIAWAVWIQDKRAVGARYTRAGGWEAPIPFERIAGIDTDPQLASNGNGTAMAMWRHTVGRIESLRYSRWDAANGWSGPDVLHGALPQPRPAGLPHGQPHPPTAPRLVMDQQGTVHAEWPSGFHAQQVQASAFLPSRGWTRPEDRPGEATAAPAVPLGSAPAMGAGAAR